MDNMDHKPPAVIYVDLNDNAHADCSCGMRFSVIGYSGPDRYEQLMKQYYDHVNFVAFPESDITTLPADAAYYSAITEGYGV